VGGLLTAELETVKRVSFADMPCEKCMALRPAPLQHGLARHPLPTAPGHANGLDMGSGGAFRRAGGVTSLHRGGGMEFLRAMNVGPGPAPLGALAIDPGSGPAQASAQGRAQPDPRQSCRGRVGVRPHRALAHAKVAMDRPPAPPRGDDAVGVKISSAGIRGGRHSALPPGRRTPPIPRPARQRRPPGPGPAIPGVRVRKVPLPAGQMGALPPAPRIPPHRGGKRRPLRRILAGRRRRRGHQAAAASGCVRASRASR
jgi:hypothetical protein